LSGHTGLLAATYAKPEGSRWTDEQWAAISARGTDILVAAAAGSGKTAVLVERILSRIADEERPLDVDRLLVATFTKAAAAEMKERIRIALEDELERRPDSDHLRRQLALLPRASVTTLHSFCLEVVERYAPLIGLDPGFRIATETEAELLRMDTLDELFEERYGREGESGALARLADLFGGERSDEPLHRLVLELHEFARSHPWPERWLREAAAAFREAGEQGLANAPWIGSIRSDAALALQGALSRLSAALNAARSPGGPHPYADTLEDDLAAVGRLLDAVRNEPLDKWSEAYAACTFGRLKACRKDGVDPALQEKVKNLRDEAKKAVSKLGEEWFVRTPEQYAEELRRLAPDMEALAELAIEFGRRYEAAKRAKGLLDFGDLEHYALAILRDPSSTPDRVLPSSAAADYRERFEEILLDEYQDTNEVQEAIVSLIARHSPGNVFMVGDVKQSIYRFRLAEPGLFLAKYKAYDVWTPQGPIAAEASGEERRQDGAAEGPEPEPAWADASSGPLRGLRIDLARNFRSRRRVVDAVNHVFRLIMREPAGEMNYDRRAELVYGEGYPAEDASEDVYAVEMILLQSGSGEGENAPAAEAEREETLAQGGAEESQQDEREAEEELETAQLEARCIAAEIRRLMGQDGSGKPPFSVYDGKSGLFRPLRYRDIVILLRATSSAAPVVLEELKAAGIPAFADLSTGYFAATEVDVMLSLLHLIDNPDQDIPLAGVLRSPIVGLTAEQLARIRLRDRSGSFWQAVQAAARDDVADGRPEQAGDSRSDARAEEAGGGRHSESGDEDWREKLHGFLRSLESWRTLARRESLASLLLALYRDTGYYDFVGGLPGGIQRQANLRALVDRARQYERNSSYRGLYRFLRFLGRMRDTGADLGAAKALGEQEDVVRLVSIHRSKGLEFPVVFVAGLGRAFNRQDLNGMFLKHKRYGFGPKFVDRDTRAAYPTLPQLAIRRRLRAELLAEEMRVLYVALTRPKEKLYLIGTTADAAKDVEKWRELAALSEEGMPDHAIAAAGRYLDWLGPASVLAGADWASDGTDCAANGGLGKPSATAWACRIVPASAFTRAATPSAAETADGDSLWNRVLRLDGVPVPETPAGRSAYEALAWTDPHAEASRVAAKTSVSALKIRRQTLADRDERFPAEEPSAGSSADSAGAYDDEEARLAAPDDAFGPAPAGSGSAYRLRRPRFMSAKRLTPAERGTAVHLVMQHLPLRIGVNEEDVVRLMAELEDRRILSPHQRQAVDPGAVAAFCRTALFERMCRAPKVWREQPFSFGLPAKAVYPELPDHAAGDKVLVQGVIDCLFPEGDGYVLIDYKTDYVPDGNFEAAAAKHRFQIRQYAEAIGSILGRPVAEGYVYFLDGGGQAVRLL